MKLNLKLLITSIFGVYCFLSLPAVQAQHLSKIGWKYYSVTGVEMTSISKKEFKNRLNKNEEAFHLYTVSRNLNFGGTALIITSVPTVALGSFYLTLHFLTSGDTRDILLNAGIGCTIGGALFFGSGILCRLKSDEYLSKSISLYNASDAVSGHTEKMEFHFKIEPSKIGLYGQF